MQSSLRKCLALSCGLMTLLSAQTLPAEARQYISSVRQAAAAATAPAEATNQSSGNNTFKGAEGSGTLVALLSPGKQLGQCPLKHTDVSCDISGYVARVTVKQTFHNPFKDKIEAVYTFPLSDSGAVDEMLMKVGERTVHGTIKKREEARQIYEQARAAGQVASLLDQERTNIFTQSVANIEPGKDIEITIKYVETLPFEKGKYTFAFPTVVGPRFMPGNAVGHQGTGRLPDTDQVNDASRISPPVPPAGERAGHDISISVHLNAGMALADLDSKLHQVNIARRGANQADISLVDKATIPNKDFVLSWNVAQDSLKSGYLTYRDPKDKDGFFTLMLVPPRRVTAENVAPKEMIFVIDCSGSQNGPPLQKCKETMNYILDHMNGNDTFQIIAFSNTTRCFAEHPQKVSAEMKERAHRFIDELQANGGTWMAPAVEAACNIPADAHRLRIVTFMTDGFVGNDFEILGMVKKLRGLSRWFPFGTGNSVNRMLIDGIAREGGGEADYVLLNSSAEAAGKKFYDRIASPVLTDVKVDFEGVNVKDVYPKEVSDVWAERPLYFKGKYTAGGAGTVTLTGFRAGKPYEQKLAVNFPDSNTANAGIASLWARAKVDRLMAEDYAGAQRGAVNKELKDEIIETALAHHIMTQYTSFVAVDEKTVTKNGKLETITVPVEVSDGVSRENTIGEESSVMRMQMRHANRRIGRMALRPGGGAGGANYFMRAPMAKAALNIQSYGGLGNAPGIANGASTGRATWSADKGLNVPAPPAAPASQAQYLRGASSAGAAPSFQLIAAGKLKEAAADKSIATDFLASSTGPANEKSGAHHQATISNGAPLEIDKDKGINKQKLEPQKTAGFEKLSASAKLLLINPSAPVEGLTRRGDRVAVIIGVQNLSADQTRKLKALGLEISKGKEAQNEVRGLIKISKLLDLANLDFVLSVLLDSDRK